MRYTKRLTFAPTSLPLDVFLVLAILLRPSLLAPTLSSSQLSQPRPTCIVSSLFRYRSSGHWLARARASRGGRVVQRGEGIGELGGMRPVRMKTERGGPQNPIRHARCYIQWLYIAHCLAAPLGAQEAEPQLHLSPSCVFLPWPLSYKWGPLSQSPAKALLGRTHNAHPSATDLDGLGKTGLYQRDD